MLDRLSLGENNIKDDHNKPELIKLSLSPSTLLSSRCQIDDWTAEKFKIF